MIGQPIGTGCPLCGAKHAACGQSSVANPVDALTRREPVVGPVRKYKVAVNGTETVLKLTDEDAKAYPDAQPLDEPADSAASADGADDASGKTRTAANKVRRATGDKTGG